MSLAAQALRSCADTARSSLPDHLRRRQRRVSGPKLCPTSEGVADQLLARLANLPHSYAGLLALRLVQAAGSASMISVGACGNVEMRYLRRGQCPSRPPPPVATV